MGIGGGIFSATELNLKAILNILNDNQHVDRLTIGISKLFQMIK